jgi:hypothetical protein
MRLCKRQQRTINRKAARDSPQVRRIEEKKERHAKKKELADSRRMWQLKEEQKNDRQESHR